MLPFSFTWLIAASVAISYVSSQNFLAYENRHISGGVLQRDSPTLLSCRLKCARTQGCAALDFDFAGRTCWFHALQAACQAPTTFMANARHIKLVDCRTSFGGIGQMRNSLFARRLSAGAPPNVLAKIGGHTENRHVIGGTLMNGLRDWMRCVLACDGRCRAVDFDRNDRSCWHHMDGAACIAPLSFRARCTHYKMTSCARELSIAPAPNALVQVPAPRIHVPAPPPVARAGAYTGCGEPFFRPNGGRIIGGDEARPHSWPWQVALRNRNARSSRCAGTFIANSWILTTAHCVDQDLNPGNWLVLSGAHDLLSVESKRIAHTVDRIILHEGFDLNTFNNDIALLKLTTPAQWGPARRPICLPPHRYEFPGGTSCLIMGWGVAANGRRPLKQADIPIVPQPVCARPDWLGQEFTLTPNMLCAGYEHGGVDTCQGDSGGPLVTRMAGKWTQVGLTSFGRGCGQPKKPGVYTKVSRFNPWIQDVMHSFQG